MLTGNDAIENDNNPLVPAGSLDPRIRGPRHGGALEPHEDGGGVHRHVHGDDDEPDELADAATVRDTEQRKGEARLAPCRREGGEAAG